MKKYIITVPVLLVTGFQQWEVEAKNKQDAIDSWEAGCCKFVTEEIEVKSLGDPEVCSAEDHTDEPSAPAESTPTIPTVPAPQKEGA